MRRDFSDMSEFVDGANVDSRVVNYHIRMKRNWFRKKPVFMNRMSAYEMQLADVRLVRPVFNVGNMIYLMLRQLEMGVEWEKQDALMHSYRDLMYKMSYVTITWYRRDRTYIHMEGQKTDVMWALSFITQVFPEDMLSCETVPDEQLRDVEPYPFQIRNGQYVGENAVQSAMQNDAVPDIWSNDSSEAKAAAESYNMPVYDPNFQPQEDEIFALPDGRLARYVKMDTRFVLAKQFGVKLTMAQRHNITASLIKDFEDLIRTQQRMEYNVYQMRYVAYMNKVHNLEHDVKGLEPSAYDMLPIGERGLPYAANDTIERTNWMDRDSLKYILEKVSRNIKNFNADEIKKIVKEAGSSVIARLRGYDIEYQMYQITSTPEEYCRDIRFAKCSDLYEDFAMIDCLEVIPFPMAVYRALCNDPENGLNKMTEFEKRRYKLFGRGYADYLAYQLQNCPSKKKRTQYEIALSRLERRYLNK